MFYFLYVNRIIYLPFLLFALFFNFCLFAGSEEFYKGKLDRQFDVFLPFSLSRANAEFKFQCRDINNVNGHFFVRKYFGISEFVFSTMDGIRQDFVIYERIYGEGPLRLNLLTLNQKVETNSGTVAILNCKNTMYSRLYVFDVFGRKLPAKFVMNDDAGMVSIEIEDNEACYPLYVDPTYLDGDWESLSSNWTDGVVTSIVADTNGNIYCGGSFTSINNIPAKRVAKWNGTQWQQMGNGFDDGAVEKMVLGQGGVIYAGGSFTRSGTTYFNRIAKWTGSNWTTLGNGFNDVVYAVAVTSDGRLFAGGKFTQSGGSPVMYFSRIAFWNGSVWSEPYWR